MTTVTQVCSFKELKLLQEAVKIRTKAQLLADNNKKAMDLLLRIQSQQEASTVSIITSKRGVA